MNNKKPNSEEEVLEVMKAYNKKKGFNITDEQLSLISEDCFLFYESKGWQNTKYWPPLVMRWLLNNHNKFKPQYKESKPMTNYKGKTIREILLEKKSGDV